MSEEYLPNNIYLRRLTYNLAYYKLAKLWKFEGKYGHNTVMKALSSESFNEYMTDEEFEELLKKEKNNELP